MESKIRVLPVELQNQIAAGEVVERPAAVVKELIENALDAGAARITVELSDAGLRLIRVTDDGEGMTPADAALAFERHATSKLRAAADLEAIRTLGFRGEALPSIAAVARVRFVTAPRGADTGLDLRFDAGRRLESRPATAPGGTVVEVADLFYNVPARRKFLKSPATELAHALRVVRQLALGYPEIAFRLLHQDRALIDLPPAPNLGERIRALDGAERLAQLVELNERRAECALHGWIGKPPFSAAGREQIEFFVNRRAVKAPALAHALAQGYQGFMLKARHPVAYLALELPPDAVDVNVHPAKREVRFRDTGAVHRLVAGAVEARLRALGFVMAEGGATSAAHAASAPPVPTGRLANEAGRAGGAAGPLAGERAAVYTVRPRPEAGRAYAPRDVALDMPASLLAAAGDTAPRLRLLGQIQDSFILVQVGDDLHILDQHAAHERLLYERLRRQRGAAGIERQPLLIPQTVELSLDEAALAVELAAALQDVGLELEPFGDRAVVVRAVPALIAAPADVGELVRELLVQRRRGVGLSSEDLTADVLASVACHAAVTANRPMRDEEMRRLIEDLYHEQVPPTCPHGRPIRRSFSRGDLEQLFYRR